MEMVKRDEPQLGMETPSELQEAMECGVCYSLYNKPVQLGCGHTYCQSCITQLAQINRGDFFDFDNFDNFNLHMLDLMEDPGGARRARRLGLPERGEAAPPEEEAQAQPAQMARRGGGWPDDLFGAPPIMDHAARQQINGGGMGGGQPIPVVLGVQMYGGHQQANHPADPNGQQQQLIQQIQHQLPQQIQHHLHGMAMMPYRPGFPQPPNQRPPNMPARGNFFVGGVRMPGGQVGGYMGRARQNGGTVSCPECRHVTTIPPTGLPVNFKLQDLIERVKSKMKPRAIGCVCMECQAPIPGLLYFACKQCPEKNTICSLCAIRKHNGHEMRECQVCSPDDVKRFRNQINHVSFDAKEQLRLLQESSSKIAAHCTVQIDLMEKEMEQFSSLERELDREEPFTEDVCLLRVQRATAIVEAYKTLTSSVSTAESQLSCIFAAAANNFSAEVSRIMSENTIMNAIPKNEPLSPLPSSSQAETSPSTPSLQAYADIADHGSNLHVAKSRAARAQKMEKAQVLRRNKLRAVRANNPAEEGINISDDEAELSHRTHDIQIIDRDATAGGARAAPSQGTRVRRTLPPSIRPQFQQAKRARGEADAALLEAELAVERRREEVERERAMEGGEAFDGRVAELEAEAERQMAAIQAIQRDMILGGNERAVEGVGEDGGQGEPHPDVVYLNPEPGVFVQVVQGEVIPLDVMNEGNFDPEF